MKLIQTSLSYLTVLGISSNRNLSNLNFFMVELIFIIHICTDCMFIIFEAKTFREYTYATFLLSTEIMAGACFTIFATKRAHIFKMINIAEKLIEKRSENPTKRAMYIKTNQTAEKWSKIALIFLAIVTPVCFIFPKPIIVCFTYFTTDLGNDAFELPFVMWLPFNWRNPIGYAIAVFIQYITTVNLFLIGVSMLSTAFEGLLIANAVINDLKIYLIEINENAKSKKNHSQTTKQLTDFIQVHTLVKQLFVEFLVIIEQMGVVFFTWCAVSVCGALLMIQAEIIKSEIDFIYLIVTIAELFDELLCICVVCEIGQRITNLFSSLADVVEQFDWYLYPQEMKRMLTFITQNVQKPVDIKCFGSFAANRESLRKILSAGFSYFTVLRNFTH